MHSSTAEDWELSKENIIPLRQGRAMESLQHSLNRSETKDVAQLKTLEEQKADFECAIKTYDGDDPLQPWLSYIDWTEQNFPKGGPEGSLAILVQECVSTFTGNTKYNNDERFIDVCIKLANMCTDPLEVYNFMFSRGMGSMVASFYITWALDLEAAGSLKKADEVYMKGLQAGAQPRKLLEMRHKQFLKHTMVRSVENRELDSAGGADAGNLRLTLGMLKPTGKKQVVGSLRTGSASIGVGGGVGASVAAPSTQKANQNVAVYKDVDTPACFLSASTVEPRGSLLCATLETVKENEHKPGKWTSAKVYQAVARNGGDEAFEIYSDEKNSKPTATLGVCCTVGTHGKAIGYGGSGNVRLMCRTTLAYGRSSEYQFEEIRAMAYKKKMKENAYMEDQHRQMKSMEQQLQSMSLQMQKMVSEMKSLKHGKAAVLATDNNKLESAESSRLNEQAACVCAPNDLTTLDQKEASRLSVPGATPTIHTKEAMEIAQHIFQSRQIAKKVDGPTQVAVVDVVGNQTFNIYRDSLVVDCGNVEETSDVNNCQNIPPEDYVQVEEKRQLAGVLLPAIGFQVEEEQDRDEDEDEVMEDEETIHHQPMDQAALDSFTISSSNTKFFGNIKFVSTPVPENDDAETVATSKAAVASRRSFDDLRAQGNVHVFKRVSVAANETRGNNLRCLHTITETSRDYKSSSSSSSGGSGGTATLHWKNTLSRCKSQGDVLPEEPEKTAETNAEEGGSDNDVDPFHPSVTARLLSTLDVPVRRWDNVAVVDGCLPHLPASSLLDFGTDEMYYMSKKLREGAYAVIYRVTRVDHDLSGVSALSPNENFIFKVQKPACEWELYIAEEVKRRLTRKGACHLLQMFVSFSRMFLFDDASVLVSDYHHFSLLDVSNLYRGTNRLMPEPLVIYLTIEMLHIVEQLHACQIIHADFKPDNIMLASLPRISANSARDNYGPACLKLIDYGRSIDMSLFPPGTQFKVRVETEQFDCVEMKENRPWTYQTDLYGAAACAHVLLFGKYMQVQRSGDGQWFVSEKIRRYWQAGLWREFFIQLLNVPSCEQLPDVPKLRAKFEQCLGTHKMLSFDLAKASAELTQLCQHVR